MEGRKRREPAPIGGLIQEFLRENGLTGGGGNTRVLRAFEDAIGASGRAHARAVRFRAGELIVEVDSAAHMHEMKNFTGEALRRRANDRLGKTMIRRIVFKLKG